MKLDQVRILRRLALSVLRRLGNFDITIGHHHTGDRISLNAYRHKGYWYHGARREAASLARCRGLVRPEATVIEVGGHIGYVSVFLARCARAGRVYVFEPGRNNLPYLRRNTTNLRNVEVVEMAAADVNALLPFYLDPLTGQNNSLLGDYWMFAANKAAQYRPDASYSPDVITAVRLDDFSRERHLHPSFLKIDVEGAELAVLRGMPRLLENERPTLMVEVTEHPELVGELLERLGYECSNPLGHLFRKGDRLRGNVFCTPRERV